MCLSLSLSLSLLFQILIQSVCETMVPKLVAEDIPLLHSLLSDVFPGVQYTEAEMKGLRRELAKVCQEMYLTYGEGDEMGTQWVQKVGRTRFVWLWGVGCGLVYSSMELLRIIKI